MIKKKSTKHHPVFDMAAACQLFANKRPNLTTRHITSPFHLFDLQRGRAECVISGKGVPSDVFVIGKGEPKQRDITKVGGVPFWPANRKWPKTKDGAEYAFLAQFNFRDSRDLFPKLPGAVLLFFVNPSRDWAFNESGFRFEWVDLNIEPITSAAPARIAEEVCPFFGVLHRTMDYPTASFGVLDNYEYEFNALRTMPGIKIGGAPSFIQQRGEGSPGFLCQLTSIQVAYDVPYPWANQKKSHSLMDSFGPKRAENQFMIGDMGALYFFMNKNGEVSCGMDCY